MKKMISFAAATALTLSLCSEEVRATYDSQPSALKHKSHKTTAIQDAVDVVRDNKLLAAGLFSAGGLVVGFVGYLWLRSSKPNKQPAVTAAAENVEAVVVAPDLPEQTAGRTFTPKAGDRRVTIDDMTTPRRVMPLTPRLISGLSPGRISLNWFCFGQEPSISLEDARRYALMIINGGCLNKSAKEISEIVYVYVNSGFVTNHTLVPLMQAVVMAYREEEDEREGGRQIAVAHREE